MKSGGLRQVRALPAALIAKVEKQKDQDNEQSEQGHGGDHRRLVGHRRGLCGPVGRAGL
ncbi:hypothetical protein MESS4_810004 [Mesorhizobium sp. STM 4661]|nr:hypothetical protein MESS4_810004 [Mesorhizobium sp. STM 4661]